MENNKPTFKQYLESREQLLKAIHATPRTSNIYDVRKYCSLVVEDDDGIKTVNLKPKQQMMVEWYYVDINNPTPDNVKLIDITEDAKAFMPVMSGAKLEKWLLRHTTERKNST